MLAQQRTAFPYQTLIDPIIEKFENFMDKSQKHDNFCTNFN